jgi:hypothetical protein
VKFKPKMEDELEPPESLDAEGEGAGNTPPGYKEEPDEPAESGKPPGYTGPEDRCGGCEYFRAFSTPTCSKYGFDAESDGHCDSFEAAEAEPDNEDKESSTTNVENDGMMESEDSGDEDEE